MVTTGDARFSLPSVHRVVVERRTSAGWGSPQVVFEDHDRECGRVHAIAAGSTVAATVDCDDHFAEDQAPTRSVALIRSKDGAWTHRDLSGEASGTPGLAPGGGHAVWVEGEDLLTWDAGSFGTAPLPTGSAQIVTVDDSGMVLGVGTEVRDGRCVIEVRGDDTPGVVPVARAARLPCEDVGLSLATPSEIHGDVSGQAGTEFVVRRAGAGVWVLADGPPVAAPGLDVYPDDPARAVWNQVTANTRGDLVALGSPDRQHVTAQRYVRSRQRWTPSRVVHDAGSPTCRRSTADSGVLQGVTFRLRLVCAGRPVVLRSRTGASWSS